MRLFTVSPNVKEQKKTWGEEKKGEQKRERERRKERQRKGEHGVQHLFDCYLGATVSNYRAGTFKEADYRQSQTALADRRTWSQVPLICLLRHPPNPSPLHCIPSQQLA